MSGRYCRDCRHALVPVGQDYPTCDAVRDVAAGRPVLWRAARGPGGVACGPDGALWEPLPVVPPATAQPLRPAWRRAVRRVLVWLLRVVR